MKKQVTIAIFTALLVLGCASEDPNIIDPPPGTTRIVVRVINAVPDDQQRKIVLDLGYQSSFVAPGSISDTVRAPSDSSFIEVVGAQSEFRSATRYRFAQQSIYDVIALGKANSTEVGFDTIMILNANASLTTLPVAQIRVVNAFPDTNISYDVRIGCPNGEQLSSTLTPFRQASLYREVPPGHNVFTIVAVSATATQILGTYECQLAERTPYSILVYPFKGVAEPQVVLSAESDFSKNSERPFITVNERDANIRVCNVGVSSVTVKHVPTGQILASNQPNGTINAYASVPTCENELADVFEASTSDGRVAIDSTSLTVRGRYTIVSADSGIESRIVIVPPAPVVYGAEGKAIIRVVHASSLAGQIAMSIGARSDAGTPTGISSGIALTQNISFGSISDPVAVNAGQIPLTITTANPPTAIKLIGRTTILPDHTYLLVVADDLSGELATYIVDEEDDAGTLQSTVSASLLSFVNGSPATESVVVSVGTIVADGTLFYRNSFVSSVPSGAVPVTVAGISTTTQTEQEKRTLLIYSIKSPNQEQLIEITSDPLRQIQGQSDRRVINATADIGLISVSYDTNYRQGKPTETVAENVAFGQSSPTYLLERDRRGTMYFYNSETRQDIYTLPIDFGPLGNSYSLIVVGKAEYGYEVIVLQEF